MRTPARFSCTRLEMSLNIAWICSKRSWITRPNRMTARLTAGAGMTANSARRQSTRVMMAMARMKVRLVSNQYMTPGPSIMRTALRSLVARAMMSPVRVRA